MIVFLYYHACQYSRQLHQKISASPDLCRFFICLEAESNLEVVKKAGISYLPAIIYDPMLKPLEGSEECQEFIDDFISEIRETRQPLRPKKQEAPLPPTPIVQNQRPIISTSNEKLKDNDLQTLLSERNALFEGMEPPLDRRMLPPQ